jgi:hypothetical protein
VDRQAFPAMTYDKTATTVRAGDQIGGDGVADVLFDRIPHGMGTETRVKALEHKKLQNLQTPGEAPPPIGQKLQFAIQVQVRDFELHFVVEPVEAGLSDYNCVVLELKFSKGELMGVNFVCYSASRC